MGSGRTMFEGLEAWTGPAAIAELDAASGARAQECFDYRASPLGFSSEPLSPPARRAGGCGGGVTVFGMSFVLARIN